FLRCLLELVASGDIPVDLQNRCRVSILIAHQRLAALHEYDPTIPAGMQQFALPVAFMLDVCLDGSQIDGKARLEQVMGDAAQRLLDSPAIECLCPFIPEGHPAHSVAGENGDVC